MPIYTNYAPEQQIISYKAKLLNEWMLLFDASRNYQINVLEDGGRDEATQNFYIAQLGAVWRALSISILGGTDKDLEKEFMKFEKFAQHSELLLNNPKPNKTMLEMEAVIRKGLASLKITEM